MTGVWQDIKTTFRAIRKWPVPYGVIVLTLAIGIGINTMFFTFFNGMVLRPLPFASPDRLVLVSESQARLEQTQRPVSAPNLRDWREQNHVFAGIQPFVQTTFDLNVKDNPERISGASVSADLFPMLGLRPVMGRQFQPEEDRPDGRPVALISYTAWQNRFNADPAILSRQIYLNNRPYDIVGVMPPGCKFPHFAEIWTPLALDPGDLRRDQRRLEVIARLAPGVSIARAQQEMTAIAKQIAAANPATNDGYGVRLRPLREAWLPPVTQFSAIAQQVQVLFVLLIACANVANLMLAQSTARRYEIALRSAVGASRFRLVRQFLTEGVVLALAGGLVGTALAMYGDSWLRTLVQIPIPYWLRFEFDRTAFIFALGVTLTAGVGFSLVPALRQSGPDLLDVLKSSARSGEAPRGNRLRRILVVSQFVMSAILLVGALLMITSFLRLRNAATGYQPSRVLTMRVSLNGEDYKDGARRIAYINKATDTIGGLAGVASASAVNYLPASTAGYDAVQLDIDGTAARDEKRLVTRHTITARYFDTMQIPLREGRTFTQSEIDEGRDVAIVSERAARQLWPGTSAIGHRVRVKQTVPGPWLTVVGTVGDTEPPFQIAGLDAWPKRQIYVPYGSQPGRVMTLAVQTRSDPEAVAADLRTQLHRIDATTPIYDVYTMSQALDLVNWIPRLWGQLFSVFGILAVLLAAAGTYSATAYAVSRRTHEIGVRMAIGARPAQILKSVLRDALTICGIGTAIGIALALPMGFFLVRLLFGVRAADPVIFAGVAVILTMVSVAAAYIPAHRAARLHPTIALRTE
jgi:putative ABC transport system permease protein